MKRLNWIIALMLMISTAITTSCSKDESDPVSEPPSITLQAGTDYISQNATMSVSTPVKFGIRAQSNASSKSNLSKFSLKRTFNGNSTTHNETLSGTSYNVDLMTNAHSQAGTETFEFSVTDANGQTGIVTIVITTTPVNGEINTYNMMVMGAQGNANGNAFASFNGTLYSLADAKANANKVDWLYYNDATDFASIASPADAHAAAIFNNATNGLQTWVVKNATRFKLITDAVDFDAITNDAPILVQTASGVTETRIPSLSAGKLIAFITQAGKSGIIRVESVTGANDGTMTMSVKVQK